jgi:solute:Na+ symporter, SSS family
MNLILFNIILVLYIAIIVFLGYLGYRGTKDVRDFMIAGRKIHPYIMAVSYGATFVSTSAIVGFVTVPLSLLAAYFVSIITKTTNEAAPE